jgi:pyruvate dehydrogenase E2 component (dihydrolipoamide acetyltransferase)
MFGISDFYGIINPNNAAILSIGATLKKPVVNENDEIVVGQVMKIGLSGDHRTIDGAVGAQYLQALKEILEAPATMLVYPWLPLNCESQSKPASRSRAFLLLLIK